MEPVFYPPDPNHQFTSSLPMDQSPQYHPVDGIPNAPMYEPYDERSAYHGLSMANMEDNVDMANRARLTQEQLAELEREFASNHKPNTEYKKALADRMRVEYPKVNNWFQNRRAKAKQQNQPRSDLLSGDEPYLYSAPGQPTLHLNNYIEAYDTKPPHPANQGILLDEDFPTVDFPSNNINGFNHEYSNQADGLVSEIGHLSQPIGEIASPSNVQNGLPMTFWPVSAAFEDSTVKVPTASVVEIEPAQYIQDSPSMHLYGIDATHASTYDNQPQYQSVTSGPFVNNTSTHSFVTSPSEEGEHAKFITPPQETSPLPGINQGIPQHDRRTSSSSELADNFDTIHLQQPQLSLGIHESSHTVTSSNPNVFSLGGLPTPDISPDTPTNNRSFPIIRDLASRRKRPRPAALQPDRSISYAGPSTASPHLRVTPPGSGRISPVRRIKSTGHDLYVKSGRIKKPGTASAQMSPRNFESCFKASDNQPSAVENLQFATLNNSGVNNHLHSHSPPVTSSQQTQNVWSDPQIQHAPVLPPYVHVSTQDNFSAYNHEAAYNWNSTHPNHTNLIGPLSCEHITPTPSFGLTCPPQSAPSHITAFSDLSSSFSADMQPSWIIPSQQASHHYRDDTQLSLGTRPSHPHHHSHSGLFGQYPTPISTLDRFPPSIGQLRSHNETACLDHKNIEFKIDTGPSPPKELAMQEPKEYQFNNQFSDTFPASTGKK